MRPTLSLFLGLLTLLSAARLSGAEREWTIRKGVRELFLDDVGIERTDHLSRVVHQPKRHEANPVLRPDTPWESRCQVYGTAYYDEQAGKFKIWYLTNPRDRGVKPLTLPTHERAPHTTLAAYAESTDGIHWVKPKLGIFPYDGDTQNNLLGVGKFNCEGISVLHEPDDPNPNRRWKAIYWDHGSGGWKLHDGKPRTVRGDYEGLCVSFSADGIHWKPYEENPVLEKYCDTNQNVVYDPLIERYVTFSRLGFGRRLARSESRDFMHWSKPQLVLECDQADGPQAQIYGAGVDLYEGVYLAMVWIYHEGTDGTIDTQLASSRDGIRWNRVGGRAVWLPLGEQNSWEGGMMRSVERIIRRGDELYIYYCGVHGAHTGPKIKKVVRTHPTAIGLATLRRDGFVSLTAGTQPGSVLTKRFGLPEGDLHLNIDTAEGTARVTLCDQSGKALPNIDPSDIIEGDRMAAKVRWKKPLPDEIRDHPVCLRIELKNAELYSYWWE